MYILALEYFVVSGTITSSGKVIWITPDEDPISSNLNYLNSSISKLDFRLNEKLEKFLVVGYFDNILLWKTINSTDSVLFLCEIKNGKQRLEAMH